MNKMVTTLGLVVLVVYAVQGSSWAHTHVVTQDEPHGPSLVSTELDEFVILVPQVGGLSQRAGQSSWNCMSLTHTDPHHPFGNEPHNPIVYRNSQTPDGGAILFGWIFQNP